MSKEEELRIVESWRDRYQMEKFKRGTIKYLSYQNMYFVGVMAALNEGAFAPWTFSILGGRDILDIYDKQTIIDEKKDSNT